MMKLLSLITPKFLKTLDNHLLLNNRLLWITKVPYMLYYSVLVALSGSALMWAYPLRTDSSNLPSVELVIFLTMLLVLPATIFWVYKQVIYNIEKNYGQTFPLMEYARFGIYLLTFGIFVSLPILFAYIAEQKIMNLVTPKELAQDAYHLNIGNPYFPTDRSGDILWDEDIKEIKEGYQSDDVYALPQLSDGRNYYNFRPFYINTFVDKNYYSYNANDEVKQFKDVFLNTYSDKTRLMLIGNYLNAYNKYSATKINLTAEEVLQRYKAHEYFSKMVGFGKEEINTKFYQISDTHNRPMNLKDASIVAICMIFSLSTLLLIFQNVKWLDFVLAAISFGVGGFVFLGTLSFVDNFFVHSYNNDLVILGMVLAFGFFFIKSLQIKSLQTFSRFKIFSLMFTNVMSPYLLLLLVVLASKLFNYPTSHVSGEDAKFWVLAGFALHTVLFMPLYRKLYMKMRALPKS